MKLTFNDRIAIYYGSILPPTGTMKIMVTAREIKAKVSFTEEEKESLTINQGNDGSLSYQATKELTEYSCEVDFTADELAILVAGAKYLDENQQVTESLLSTVEMLLL